MHRTAIVKRATIPLGHTVRLVELRRMTHAADSTQSGDILPNQLADFG
jgi:hypothetical protein